MPRVTRFYQASVGTSVVQIVSYNRGRSGVLVRNYSGATCFVSPDGSDPLTTGYPVAEGEFLALLRTEGDAPELQLYGQCSSGTADLRIVESFGELRE
jgi:hypothetical protein